MTAAGWRLRPRRRAWIAAALFCVSCGLACGPSLAADPVPAPTRTELLHEGESALARGDTAAAIASFERAALMLHAADTEMALVRAAMQSGAYRQALAFCAHTAGAHHDAPDASALYAWLLQAGGQGTYAARVLEEARAIAPDDEVLAAARLELRRPAPRTTPLLLRLPHRLAPRAVMVGEQAPVDVGARVVGSGVLMDFGRHALVPLAMVGEARAVWVRNGLGQATRADIERRVGALGIALLRLPLPLDPGPDAGLHEMAPRDPFPGSPGFAVEFHATPDSDPAWPWLHLGFLGSPQGSSGARRLGITMPAGEPRGGPVFDAAGRLAGIVVTDDDGADRWWPASLIRAALGQSGTAAEAASSAARKQADDIYERSLRVALQVIVTP